MTFFEQVRKSYPDWAKVTPAKQRILQFLVDNGGETQFWPGYIVRSIRPLALLGHVGFVESWQVEGERHARYRITQDGRDALAAAA